MRPLGRFAAVLALVCALAVSLLLADGGAAHQVRQARPVKLGTSGGNVMDISRRFCCSGTLGSLVTKGGDLFVLSNNHVLARSGQARVGEDISQPGLIDSACRFSANDIVADFSQAVPLNGAAGSNVDAALARARSGAVDSSGAILDIGQPASAPATPAVSVGVAKSGRTTGLTCASIGSINTDVSVQYQKGCGSGKKFVITYNDQVVINSTSFSAGGDSGSLIVTSGTAQPVALLYAGSSSTTIGNPVQDVINALGISFVGGGTHTVNCPAATAAASTQVQGTPSAADMARATAVKNAHSRRLMADPAVMAVGVGAGSQDPSQAAIVVYVEEGSAHGRIPARLESLPVEIIRTDRIRAFGWNESARKSCSKQ